YRTLGLCQWNPAADTAASTAGVARVSRVKWEYKSSNEKSRRGLRNYVANAVATRLPASPEPCEGGWTFTLPEHNAQRRGYRAGFRLISAQAWPFRLSIG